MSERVGYPPHGAAPIMKPDDRAQGSSHWCDAVGSTVYAPQEECPYCGDERGDDDD